MKVKRFSTARDKELKCTDPESYIDENGILYPRLAKMPIQDLSLIANFRVEMMNTGSRLPHSRASNGRAL